MKLRGRIDNPGYLSVKIGDRIRIKKDQSTYGYVIGDTAVIVSKVNEAGSYSTYEIRRDRDGQVSRAWSMPTEWFDLVPPELPITDEELKKVQDMKSHDELGKFLGL